MPEEYQKYSKEELELTKNKNLLEYWRENGQALEFIRMLERVKYPEYWVEPREHKFIDNLWTDIDKCGTKIFLRQNSQDWEGKMGLSKMYNSIQSSKYGIAKSINIIFQ